MKDDRCHISVETNILATEILLELAMHEVGLPLGALLPIITNRYDGFTEDQTREALRYLLETEQVFRAGEIITTYDEAEI